MNIQNLKNKWWALPSQIQIMIGLIAIIAFGMIGYTIASFAITSIHDWYYSNKQAKELQKEEGHKADSIRHEQNANTIQANVDAEKQELEKRSAETKVAVEKAAGSKIIVKEKVKHYEQVKNNSIKRRNNDDRISDAELCTNGKLAGIEIDGCN